MKADFDGQLTRRMEDAAMLPPEHPMRSEVERDVREAGPWAQRQWEALLRENDALRHRLAEPTLPAGLEDRLLRIPETAPKRWRTVPAPALAAAVIALLAIVSLLVVNRSHDARHTDTIAGLAALIAADHSSHPELTVRTDDPEHIIDQLKDNAPFEIHPAVAPASATLLGARICRFEQGPLVYMRFIDAGEEISMYQLRLSDFNIPANLAARNIMSASTTDRPAKCRVRLWSDQRFAYAIVRDETKTKSTGS